MLSILHFSLKSAIAHKNLSAGVSGMTTTTTAVLLTNLLALMAVGFAHAGEVKILAADFHHNSNNRWRVNVTLKHHDTGWDHFADKWRLVDEKGNVLGDRVLFHPHMEQPFTRSLGGVQIPEGMSTIHVEAHDKVHGWTPDRLKVDMRKSKDGELRIEAK